MRAVAIEDPITRNGHCPKQRSLPTAAASGTGARGTVAPPVPSRNPAMTDGRRAPPHQIWSSLCWSRARRCQCFPPDSGTPHRCRLLPACLDPRGSNGIDAALSLASSGDSGWGRAYLTFHQRPFRRRGEIGISRAEFPSARDPLDSPFLSESLRRVPPQALSGHCYLFFAA